ncbi:MAG: vitamin B12-dependent ribonucleotide reductase, partial [Acidobacteria bacterium]|nr:vitamin B12-dependent ribonucleotide reductase [Acidobacteriota bacterium]
MQVAVEPTTVGPRSETEKTRREQKNGRGGGLEFRRRFTERGVSPYDQVEWEKRDAVITDEHGETIFAQHGVEFPKSWSMMATTIVASKYFHGSLDKGERESSVRQLVGRVADQIADWGVKDGYFADQEAADTFRDELTFLLLNQFAAFNSPVWFNCGVEEHPQCSACFINSVEDTMESILTLAR